MHTHFIPPDVMRWIRDNQQVVNAKWEHKNPGQEPFLTVNEKWGFELKTAFIDPDTYLKEQEKAGVHHSLISPVPQLFMYDFPDEITGEMASVYNQSLADWSQANNLRISALATVPLHNPNEAAKTLDQAMALGLKGAIIGPGLPDRMLTNDFFIPFWEAANEKKAIVFIHPLLSEDPRLKQRMMPNLIGIPWETTVCATDLLLSGFLDKFPYVRILLAHGGGFLPYQIGRLNQGYSKWNAVSSALQAPPIEYLRRLWFDSVLWDPSALQALIQIVGANKVVPGSDYPFDLCTWPPQTNADIAAKALLG